MILIAHRGNISGPSPEKENNPRYIDFAIETGYNVDLKEHNIFGYTQRI
jgi:hypothetical protein